MGDEETFVRGFKVVAAVVIVAGSIKLLWGWCREQAWPWVGEHRLWAALVAGVIPFVVWGLTRLADLALDLVHSAFDAADSPNWHDSAEAYTLAELEEMTPDEFEQACAALLIRDGFDQVEQVGGAGDLGADVIAWDDDRGKLVVQCKQYAGRVGSQDVQRFNGTARPVHHADIAMMVALNGFTLPAAEFASDQEITLIGRAALEQWAGGAHLLQVIDEVPFAA